ncbi:MAG: MFS transporter, partial [Chloroflexota bacterium]|nr:MFS transporter [Chloroflexota bacterium]
GIMIGTVGIGVSIGPVLGGVLIEILDWRAIFWTRIPLGVIGSLLVIALLRDTPADERPTGLDLPGSFTLFFLLSAAVLAVNRGQAWGWGSPAIVGLFAATAVLVVLFIQIERRSRSPVVDLDLFRRVPFSGGILSAVLQFFGLTGSFTLMPFYLIDGRGFSTLEAGAITVGFPLAMLVGSPLSGRLADRVGPRRVAVAGLVVVAAGLLSLATMNSETPVAGVVLRMIVAGAGAAIFMTPNTMVIMASVGPERAGTASAAQTTARTMGNAIGLAVAGALFTSHAARYALERSPLGLDDPIVAPDALISGIRLAFLVAGIVAVVAIPPALARGRARPPDP